MTKAIMVLVAPAVLFVLTSNSLAEDTKGKINSVDATKNEVVIKGTLRDTPYHVDKNTYIFLDGAAAKIGDLAADDRATISYEKKGDNYVASEIRCLRHADESVGTINEVIRDKHELVVKESKSNANFEMSKNSSFALNGKKVELNDLKPGDFVLITYQTKDNHKMIVDLRASRK
jgi:hypothetical protein